MAAGFDSGGGVGWGGWEGVCPTPGVLADAVAHSRAETGNGVVGGSGGPTVPAAGVVDGGRDATLLQHPHQTQRGAGGLGGIPQVGEGLGQAEAPRGAGCGGGGGGAAENAGGQHTGGRGARQQTEQDMEREDREEGEGENFTYKLA